MKKPLYSILTPTYNRGANFLPQTIRSIQNQKEDGFTHEHIIADNASTDKTEKIVREFAKKDKRIIYVKNKSNLGAAGGLNSAFKKSKGDFIIPLDDDDLLPMSSLQMRHNFHQANPKIKWSYGYSLFIDQNNKLTDKIMEYSIAFKKERTDFLSLWGRCYIPNGTVTMKREIVEKVNGWTPGVQTQDFDMWLRLAAAKIHPYLIESYLCLYRVHRNQMTKKLIKRGTFNIERDYYIAQHKQHFKE